MKTTSTGRQHASPATDRAIIRALWPVLLAAIIGLFPFTVYSTFLVPIADTADTDEAIAGMLRGLGGVAALAIGVGLAPLLARWSRPHTIGSSLILLAAVCVIGATGSLAALIVFCLGIGATTAVLTPALLGAATTAFTIPGDAGRAATLVTATQSLAAMLAAPVIGVLGWQLGWQGALLVTAGVASVGAAAVVRASRAAPRPDQPEHETPVTRSPGYFAAFRELRARPDLLALIAVAALRTASFMGYLAFLAVQYHDAFDIGPEAFTLIWTLSGAAFFAGNYLAGRWGRSASANGSRTLLLLGLAGGTAAVLTVFTVQWLPLALMATVVMGFSHATVAAQVTTSIAHRGGVLTTTAYSINASGMSLGVFAGAALGGLGLSIGGSAGLAIALATPSLVAMLLIRAATARH